METVQQDVNVDDFKFDDEVSWDHLETVYKETSQTLISALASLTATVNNFKDDIDNNVELSYTIKGVYDTYNDLSIELTKIGSKHLVGNVFKSGVIEDNDDKLTYLFILNGYTNVQGIISNIMSTSFLDIISKLKTTPDLDMSKTAKPVVDVATTRTAKMTVIGSKRHIIKVPNMRTWDIKELKIEAIGEVDSIVSVDISVANLESVEVCKDYVINKGGHASFENITLESEDSINIVGSGKEGDISEITISYIAR